MITLPEHSIRLESIFEAVQDGIITVDAHGSILSFNHAAAQIFACDAAEMIGESIDKLLADDEAMRQVVHDAISEPASHKVLGTNREIVGRRSSGQFFSMELGLNNIESKGQSITVISVRDVTWRTMSEDRLRDEATRLNAIMNTVLDALITIDKTGIIQGYNPAAARLFGYTAEEAIGQNVSMLMPEPYRSSHDQYLHNYLTTGVRKIIGIGREAMAQRKDGSTFPIEIGINEMNVNGQRMFVGTVRNITERKEAEASIMAYISKLTRSNQDLDDFAYIASHDLKEPIRGITNNALFLLEDYAEKVDVDGQRRINRMVFLCKRMEQLVDELLYFSRLGRQDLAIQNVDVAAMLRDIEILLEPVLHEKNGRLIVHKPLTVVRADMPRLREAFHNLITNALKYNTNHEKKIEIGMAPESTPSRPIFFVRDNGIGIDAKYHDEIFRIFRRLNDEDDNVKGVGVGLTFVKKIVERHDGRIWLESKPGHGSTFYFSISQQEVRR